MRRILVLVLVLGALFAGALGLSVPLLAQSQPTNAQQKSFLTNFVEDRLSTPDRKITLSNINGVLSSDATIDKITISDNKGVWLTINEASINWNQAALITGKLEINTLTARSIDYTRNPIPAKGKLNVPAPEAGGLQIPQLPVAVILKKLDVPKVTFGQGVFGLSSVISVDGGLTLEGGSLDANLAVKRLDGPGGALALKVKYAKNTKDLNLDLSVSEPPDGIIANLLHIDGKPAVKLALNGAGPISAFKSNLSLKAGGKPALLGAATIRQTDAGFVVSTDLGGPIGQLMAPAYRGFFGPKTTLSANGVLRNGGGVTLKGLKLTGGELSLDASGSTGADGFLNTLSVHGQIADGGEKVRLPVPGAATKVSGASLDIDFGTAADNKWNAKLALEGFENGALDATDVVLNAGGVARNLDQPGKRALTFNADGSVSGITARDKNVADALGTHLGFGAAGLWNAGHPVQLAQLRVIGKALMLNMAGAIDNSVFNGEVKLKTASLTPFSGVAGRSLSGALALDARGTISPLIGGFNLALNGTADNLAIGDNAIDRVLAGEVKLGGRLARTEAGFSADHFSITNNNVQFGADGTFATGAANFNFKLALADLGLLAPEASGPVTMSGKANGDKGDIAIKLDAEMPNGTLAGRALTSGGVRLDGHLNKGAFAGKLSGAGSLAGRDVSLASDILVKDDERVLSGLEFVAGATTLTGDVTQRKDGLVTGKLKLASSDIGTAAALALVKASGAINADIALDVANGKQAASASGTVRAFKSAGVSIDSADFKAQIADLFGVPQVEGTLAGKGISAAGVSAQTVAAKASRSGPSTQFSADATLQNGTAVNIAGALTPLKGGYRLALDRVGLTQGALRARLVAPAMLSVNDGQVSLKAVRFDVGGGEVNISGSAGTALDISVALKGLPLAVANAVVPSLKLSGTLDGSARITGSSSDPRASFTVRGRGLDAAAIADFGVAPLSAEARGTYGQKQVKLASLNIRGAKGLTVTGSGTVPIMGAGLDISVAANAPLALANRFVADRGGQASGIVRLEAKVSGSIANPRYSGNISTRGASYVDPSLNLKLQNISGQARLTGSSLSITSLSAAVATGGNVKLAGSVSLTAAGFPADLKINLDRVRYADGDLVVATASGALTLKGTLTQNALLAGQIRVEKADISVPEKLGGGVAQVNVKHVDLPPDVARTLARGKVDMGGRSARPGKPSNIGLDVRISAPNQIFVRGRGLDVELGGAVHLTGSVSDIVPVGAFNLVRGRLSILGQRLDFNSGSVTLTGDLDPILNLVAETKGDDITVTVTVSGRVSDISVSFTSTPTLPQDEVLSRLLFKQGLSNLSPLQLAQLAAAASSLAGGSNSSLLDSLRSATGLDDLDIVTDAEGNSAVKAGRYLTDKIYLGVQAGSGGNDKVTVDLDIAKGIKAQAATGNNGDSSVGLFFQKDY